MLVRKIHIYLLVCFLSILVLSIVGLYFYTFRFTKESDTCSKEICGLVMSEDKRFYTLHGILVDKFKRDNNFYFNILTLDNRGNEIIVRLQPSPFFNTILINNTLPDENGDFTIKKLPEDFFNDAEINQNFSISFIEHDSSKNEILKEKYNHSLLACSSYSSTIIKRLKNPGLLTAWENIIGKYVNGCSVYIGSIIK